MYKKIQISGRMVFFFFLSLPRKCFLGLASGSVIVSWQKYALIYQTQGLKGALPCLGYVIFFTDNLICHLLGFIATEKNLKVTSGHSWIRYKLLATLTIAGQIKQVLFHFE